MLMSYHHKKIYCSCFYFLS